MSGFNQNLSNYPPGVTGNEPEFGSHDEPDFEPATLWTEPLGAAIWIGVVVLAVLFTAWCFGLIPLSSPAHTLLQ